ncbi:MAG: FAD-dependent oxidoreductase, partial [Candidatus Aminicenantes bacterium]|nr:FAD-dependent oxidoreductase [Candidatus Aminicenantes bacterium]
MAEYLIIGADAAGLSAALQIKRKKSRADLKVLAKGRIISYGACGIPYVLSGEIASAESLIHFTPERFREKADIPVETGREAIGLFPESHEVEVKNLDTGEVGRETYGRLLIATGAVPRRLPSLDYGQEGVFTLHTVEDLRRALSFIQEKKPGRAVVVGAGNVGLEVIEALHRRGLDPTVIDILDSAAANWPQPVRSAVLEKIREKKIDFRPGTAVESMERCGPGFILKASGQDIAADIIFSQAGTRPATDWCRNRLA